MAKIIIMTGCSAGIGLATAKRLAHDPDQRFVIIATVIAMSEKDDLVAAVGDTRKQGNRNLGRRDEDMATDVAKFRLQGKSVTEAVAEVSGQRDGLSHSTINEAWRKYKDTAYIRAQIENGARGKKLSKKQFKIMLKDLKKIKQQ